MILVDTSVWIDHLHRKDPRLVRWLGDEQVAIHSFVLGELACGGLPDRDHILSLLATLPLAPTVDHLEFMTFLESQRLWGRGLGFVDAHLLASAQVDGHSLWSHDRLLREFAACMGLTPEER